MVLDAATSTVLDKIFDAQFTATGIAGMAAGVWIGGAAWNRTAGFADLSTKTAYRAHDHVRIASITKSFTATATLQLVDAGKLALDDTLEKFVPGIANGTRITVRDLLGMTSGIFDFTSDKAAVSAFDANPTMPWSYAKTVAVIKSHAPLAAPGTTVSYCDSNYVLLGMIIETVTGMPVADVITEQIIDRLGLRFTSYPTTTAIAAPHPVGYLPGGDYSDPNKAFDNVARPPSVTTNVNPAFPATAGAMISSLNDLRVWGIEIAAGTLLKPATQALRLASKRFPGQKFNFQYGLGCEVLNDFMGHNGAIVGFSSVVLRDPKKDVTIAAVGNEGSNFSIATSLFAYAVIKDVFPDQWH